jgi:hypothetical protein
MANDWEKSGRFTRKNDETYMGNLYGNLRPKNFYVFVGKNIWDHPRIIAG